MNILLVRLRQIATLNSNVQISFQLSEFRISHKTKMSFYSRNSNKMSKFEGFDYEMLKFSALINFSHLEIALFGVVNG